MRSCIVIIYRENAYLITRRGVLYPRQITRKLKWKIVDAPTRRRCLFVVRPSSSNSGAFSSNDTLVPRLGLGKKRERGRERGGSISRRKTRKVQYDRKVLPTCVCIVVSTFRCKYLNKNSFSCHFFLFSFFFYFTRESVPRDFLHRDKFLWKLVWVYIFLGTSSEFDVLLLLLLLIIRLLEIKMEDNIDRKV